MADVDLTTAQRHTLRALVDHHQSTGGPVASATLATDLDRDPQTVRNRMSTLAAVGLVEGIQGPSGGYVPTERGYDHFGRSADAPREQVVFANGFERLSATVDGISFANVHSPAACTAHVSVQQSIDGVACGDPVVVGPTPLGALVVAGTVAAVDADDNVVSLDVARLDAPVTPRD